MRVVLLGVQGFLALNALVGGLLLMMAPDGALLQLPRGFMHSTLFADFFWPGAILFGVLGLGHGAGFVLTLRRSVHASRAAFILGAGTVIWIGVQVLMTELFWLQGFIAALGLMEVVVSKRGSRSS
ncbi:MAG TPA: hypothetical protein PKY96_17930 [Flavobacteriales bacterium]|nr:hypothetical protein [Flavobacteriales bacterium]